MDKKVNKICFARIHKTSIKQNANFTKNKYLVNENISKNMTSIDKTIEYIEELSNVILSHKIQLQHIKNNPNNVIVKDFEL